MACIEGICFDLGGCGSPKRYSVWFVLVVARAALLSNSMEMVWWYWSTGGSNVGLCGNI